MARLSEPNLKVASEIVGRYPRPKSALIPILHLAQEQEGWVSNAAMAHIAELLDITAAEVYGTATFYEMFKFEPVGTYCINICSNISCPSRWYSISGSRCAMARSPMPSLR